MNLDPRLIVLSQVGLCLNAWSQVETGMGIVFGGVSGMDNYRNACTIFDAILSFDARIAVLDTAVRIETTFLDQEDREIWAALSARLRKLYKRRHEVAHFSVDYGTMIDKPGIRPFFSWNKHAKDEAKFLSLKEMQELSDRFTEASTAIHWFNNVAQRKRLPPQFQPQPVEEPPLIAHIRESLAQKKAGQTPRHQPSPE
jgi:hypothetical protein